jgi:hypothetical protein
MQGYATKQAFGGQRASIGRVVVIRDLDGTLAAGMIDLIYEDTDRPRIVRVDSGVSMPGLKFCEAKDEEAVRNLPPDTWTWPPRV